MKKFLSLWLVCFFLSQVLYSQTIVNTGKPITEIFTDFHYNINDTSKTTGFGLNRAHFGYNYQPRDNFSATIIVNIGSPEELNIEEKHRRYAYFKEASISWSKDKLNLSIGITKTRIIDYQQKFWGKRYIADNFLSVNGYGYIADLGFAMDYKINDIFKADFTLMNGEGYSELQFDNSLKTSAGITITPDKLLAIRLYGDISRPHGILQYTLIGFAGIKNELITIGFETSYKSNIDMTEGHHVWGFSGTGAISLADKTEIFARYDFSSSAKLPGDNIQWNYEKDGSFGIVGIQYTVNQNYKMALNYQGTFPFIMNRQITDAIFLNAMFRF